ncbi:MAG TPA: RraA family protein [Tepidisphaeraceae bacterium]|nr:RraA family protein [Tepidisphaeraceae bacterium]
MSQPDPFRLAERFARYLRVTDVTDGLDALGRAELCLMSRRIRPLWLGVRFWGPAVTLRVLPTNQPMPLLSRQQALEQHAIWNRMGGFTARIEDHVTPGCVIVTSTGGARECGFFGSNNSLALQAAGAVGIVTEGCCRDSDELIAQRSPVACAGIGRTIIPGRVQVIEVQTPISCGGVMVRPGDLIGCDFDGCVVVPIEIAEEVLAIAARIAVEDKKSRRQLYERLGKPPDESVDWQAAAEFFSDLL